MKLKLNIKSDSTIAENNLSFVLDKSIVPSIVKGGVYEFISQSDRHLKISPVQHSTAAPPPPPPPHHLFGETVHGGEPRAVGRIARHPGGATPVLAQLPRFVAVAAWLVCGNLGRARLRTARSLALLARHARGSHAHANGVDADRIAGYENSRLCTCEVVKSCQWRTNRRWAGHANAVKLKKT